MTCPQDPAQPQNRPGLASLRYRIGDHATFYQRLLDRLSCPVPAAEANQTTDLHRLTTRTEDDTMLALLDAAAVVGDVLTFYQERLINEGYLRTAIERRSVLELARAIGYELSPGVAASTFLAFTVEETASAPKRVKVPKGTQIMSVPSKDELPQTFETAAEFTARVDWNSLQPRLTRPQAILPETQQLYLAGISTQLQAGDWILLMDAADPDRPGYLLSLQTVEPVVAAGYTIVTWIASIPAIIDPIPREPKILAFRQKAGFFGNNAPNWADLLPDVKRAQGATLKGGVFEGQPTNPPTWISRNVGLPNADVLCLVAHGDFWLAGTPVGLFRSNDNGITWEPSNTGLTNTYVQTLYSDSELNRILAGTASGGLFRSSDHGETWVPIHTGKIISEKQAGDKFIARNYSLPDTIVRATLAAKIDRFRGQGNISSSGTTITGTSTIFSQELRVNSQVTILEQKIDNEVVVPQQTFVVQSIGSNTSLNVVPQSFASGFLGVPASHGFVQYQLPDSTSFSATNRANGLSDITTTQGRIISQGRTVIGSGTLFQALQRSGSVPGESTITVGNQTRRITAILSNNRLTINEPFVLESLNANTQYYIDNPSQRTYLAGTDEGLYWAPSEGLPSDRMWQPVLTLQGQVVYALITGEASTAGSTTLFAATSSGVYRFNPNTKQWESLNLQKPAFCIAAHDNFLFAGTEEGLHQSPLDGSNWQRTHNSLPQNTRVLSLAFYKQNDTYHLCAGTEQGLYYTQDNGEHWQEVNTLATRQEIPALAAKDPSNSTIIFAGSRFAGFVETEWPGFAIPNQPIDLDGLYPKILPESEIIIVNGQAFERLQVKDVSTEPQRQFLLTNKVTRLLADRAIASPELFDRRRTIVLTQSDPLALAPEQLTVEIQQEKIFQDPLLSDRIYLKEFIQGLQPNQPLLISGRHLQAQVQDIGGIFRSIKAPVNDQLTPIQWEQTNFGLTNTHVLAITQNKQQILFVGTREGVFRSRDGGDTWEPSSEGLLNQTVQALISQDGVIIAGTPDGIYRSDNNGTRWQASNTGLAHRDIRVLTPAPDNANAILAGTFNGGIFRSEDQGQTWMATRLTNTDVNAIAIPAHLSYIPTPVMLVGTEQDGLFRSTNQGNLWQQIKDIRPGTGTITSQGNRVFGKNTTFLTELKSGDRINVSGQIRTVLEIKKVPENHPDYNCLVIDVPFRPDIAKNTEFTIYTGLTNCHITAVGVKYQPGFGKITSQGTTLQGTAAIGKLLKVGDLIFAAQQTRTITAINEAEPNQVMINQAFNAALVNRTSYSVSYLFAGTAGSGIFRSTNLGDRWEAVNTNLTDLQIRCLTLSDTGELWVGTASGGVFRSINNGDVWEAVNLNLTNTDIRVLYFAKSAQEPEPDQIQTLLQNWLEWLDIHLEVTDGVLRLNTITQWLQKLLTYLSSLLSEKTLLAGGVGILRSLEDFTTVEVQPGDTLEILQAPEPRRFSPGNLQRWALQDRNGFVGVIDTTSPKILKLLPASPDRDPVSELVYIKTPPEDQQKPILELSDPLQHSYDPATVKVYANVIAASHGETTEEALGSGDGTVSNQQFFLKVQPLTFVSAATATGSASTLELRVDGVLWKSAPSLYPLDDRDRRYILRTEDDGSTRVIFGDGIKGARLPTGLENVTALYRAGIGTAGNVPAERLSLLKTRPLGIQSVINPLAATGGADRESLAEARTKVPRTVRTLDRIVSLRDFEDFARTFAGIGKAQSVALWNGDAQVVHLTIAGVNGADIPLESSLYLNLIDAIDEARDPIQQVQVDPYEAIRFNLEARLVIDESYDAKAVETQVRSRLLDSFAFNQRRFGQAITASEAIAAIQQVPGIIAVDLDALYRLGSSKALEQQLLAQPARWDFAANRSLPAQLLLPNPAGLLFTPIPAL
ncbi:putative baseplate assembly protein [Alkalinema pantanalense CENA528]|uniref:putative baseplate assembly protein n=1 Tax=Alkalinema pantanalense TaxID=1620705 RepID=UPI003D700B2F